MPIVLVANRTIPGYRQVPGYLRIATRGCVAETTEMVRNAPLAGAPHGCATQVHALKNLPRLGGLPPSAYPGTGCFDATRKQREAPKFGTMRLRGVCV
eukprot:853886-Rhodomonas_salina.1